MLESRKEGSCAVAPCVEELSDDEGFGKARVLAPVPSEDLREGSRFASIFRMCCSTFSMFFIAVSLFSEEIQQFCHRINAVDMSCVAVALRDSLRMLCGRMKGWVLPTRKSNGTFAQRLLFVLLLLTLVERTTGGHHGRPIRRLYSCSNGM